MTKQERFEAMWADRHSVPVETMAKYRFKDADGYRLPGMAAHYRTFCAAWDMIEAELPKIRMTDCLFSGSNLDGSLPIQVSRGPDGLSKLEAIDMRGWICRGPRQEDPADLVAPPTESVH